MMAKLSFRELIFVFHRVKWRSTLSIFSSIKRFSIGLAGITGSFVLEFVFRWSLEYTAAEGPNDSV